MLLEGYILSEWLRLFFAHSAAESSESEIFVAHETTFTRRIFVLDS